MKACGRFDAPIVAWFREWWVGRGYGRSVVRAGKSEQTDRRAPGKTCVGSLGSVRSGKTAEPFTARLYSRGPGRARTGRPVVGSFWIRFSAKLARPERRLWNARLGMTSVIRPPFRSRMNSRIAEAGSRPASAIARSASHVPARGCDDHITRPLSAEDLERFRAYLALLARLQVAPGLRDRVDLSGVVQQTLLEAFQEIKRAPRERTEGETAAWLRSILGHNLADGLRKLAAQQAGCAAGPSLTTALDESASRLGDWLATQESSPSQKVIRQEQMLRIAGALASLSREPAPGDRAASSPGMDPGRDRSRAGHHQGCRGRPASSRAEGPADESLKNPDPDCSASRLESCTR